jgi:hypothetical protein
VGLSSLDGRFRIETPLLTLRTPPYEIRRQRHRCPRRSPRYVSRCVRTLLVVGLMQWTARVQMGGCYRRRGSVDSVDKLWCCAFCVDFRSGSRVGDANVALAVPW